ncbi:hypothetical protein BCR33DRAFT_716790, partial [Rhizoclosmatium globosum]
MLSGMDDVDAAIEEVRMVVPFDVSVSDIRLDLGVSGSAEATINRWFDGLFLEGTPRDPSLSLTRSQSVVDHPKPATEVVPPKPRALASFVISDDSDSDAPIVDLSAKLPKRPSVKPDVVVIDDSDTDLDMPPLPKKSTFESYARPSPPIASFASSTTSVSIPAPVVQKTSVAQAWKSQFDAELALLDSSEDETAPKPKKRQIVGLSQSLSSDSSDGANSDKEKRKKKKSSSASRNSLTSLMDKKYGTNSFASSDSDSDPERARKKKKASKRKSYSSDSSDSEKKSKKSSKRSRKHDSSDDSSEEESSSKRTKKSLVDKAEKEAEKARKAEERERIKAEKAEAKLREKEEKAREKEEKARQKELKKQQDEEEKRAKKELKDANVQRNKHAIVTEMSVHVDPAFVTALPGGAKILDAIQEAGAKLKMVPQPIHSAIEWSRNVTREFDIAGDKWIPCEPRTEREPYLLVRLSASEFSKLVLRPGGDGVQSYIANIRRQFGSKSKLIILLEGIKELLKSRTKNISAHIQNEIRGGGGGGGGGSRQHLEPIASKEDMDAQLLWLQMFGDCFVQQAESLEETCGLIVSFTTTIAMIPERKYRSETHLRLNFGDEVKKGDSIQDH